MSSPNGCRGNPERVAHTEKPRSCTETGNTVKKDPYYLCQLSSSSLVNWLSSKSVICASTLSFLMSNSLFCFKFKVHDTDYLLGLSSQLTLYTWPDRTALPRILNRLRKGLCTWTEGWRAIPINWLPNLLVIIIISLLVADDLSNCCCRYLALLLLVYGVFKGLNT